MDFITGLPEDGGMNTIWVIVDRLTKMAHFVACKDTMGPKALADGFLMHVVRAHGLPSSIISDRGSLFTSQFWKKVMEAMGTSRNLSTAFHPESDGQTERINAILEQYLRAYCNYQQNNWNQLLPMAEFCYNNSRSETTKVSPSFTNYGYHPRFTQQLGEVTKELPGVSEYVGTLNKLHEDLRAEIHYAQTTHAEQANWHRHPDPVLRAGDQVWLKRKNVKTTRPSNKLDYKLLGPYTILARVGSRAYKLDLPSNVNIHPVFHISLLEPSQPTSTTIPGHIQPPPLPIILDDEEEWEVEEIVDSRRRWGKIQYRVKWTGFHDPDTTWYPTENFQNSPNAVTQFHRRYPNKPASQF
jgi:hypothetical protein